MSTITKERSKRHEAEKREQDAVEAQRKADERFTKVKDGVQLVLGELDRANWELDQLKAERMQKQGPLVDFDRKRLEDEVARLRAANQKTASEADERNRAIFARTQKFVDAYPKIVFAGNPGNFGWEFASRPFRTKNTLDRFEHEQLLDFLGRAAKYAPHDSDPAFTAVIADLKKWHFSSSGR